jgi:hypothetical protein
MPDPGTMARTDDPKKEPDRNINKPHEHRHLVEGNIGAVEKV